MTRRRPIRADTQRPRRVRGGVLEALAEAPAAAEDGERAVASEQGSSSSPQTCHSRPLRGFGRFLQTWCEGSTLQSAFAGAEVAC
jgi:hypothetical protein